MKSVFRTAILSIILVATISMDAQNSVAHRWMEVNLNSVRRDFAKPVVHARNLWHTSVAMYDAWAVYDSISVPYFLGVGLGTYDCPFDGVPEPANIEAAQRQALSYAAYRMLAHRYAGAPFPGNGEITFMLDTTMTGLGYNPAFTSVDYVNDGPGALGNYIAQELIAAGMLDGSNEVNDYENQVYLPVNDTLVIDEAHFMGNPDILDLNRWQPIGVTLFCDQNGNSFTDNPEFLGAEWGNVIPFAMADSVKTVLPREGNDWTVYHDPGVPPYLALEGDGATDVYRWGFDLVAKWSSFLDPNDPTTVDISPASLGNIPIESMPDDIADFDQFYNRDFGGDTGVGYAVNPSTGLPYDPQIVKRGDYARILAEFWADGPDSETPPGHWFAIYNEVSQYPEFTWMWNGQGDPLPKMEYDIKAYFTMGGAMHDAAVASWSVKGYYDYIRPVSAIRAMAELGQSSDDLSPNYHPAGLQLENGFIELIAIGDTIYESDTFLVATSSEENMLKMMCWKGPLVEDTCISGFAPDYQTELAGVGWKFALDWWPYQRPTFVTPPFAGYVSGHSTFSRAAAEVMTLVTGDSFFPGGLGEFTCPQNNFLVFEEGPSEDIILQWATYQDASDQCSLSRIYGGIHPPADDIPGRKMGYDIGHNTFTLAERYFNGGVPQIESITFSDELITDADDGSTLMVTIEFDRRMNMNVDPEIFSQQGENTFTPVFGSWTNDSIFVASLSITDGQEFAPIVEVEILGGKSLYGVNQIESYFSQTVYLDMLNPTASAVLDETNPAFILIDLTFDESMDMTSEPMILFPVENPVPDHLMYNSGMSSWSDATHFQARYDIVVDAQLSDIDIAVTAALDSVGNPMSELAVADLISVDLRAPSATLTEPNGNYVFNGTVGTGTFTLTVTYDEAMDQTVTPTIAFPQDDPTLNTLTLNAGMSGWTSATEYTYVYDVADAEEVLSSIDVSVTDALDLAGIVQDLGTFTIVFFVDTEDPVASTSASDDPMITDVDASTDWTYTFEFSEDMDMTVDPTVSFPGNDPSPTLTFDSGSWTDATHYTVTYTITDLDAQVSGIGIEISAAQDIAGNEISIFSEIDVMTIEMLNPSVSSSLISMGLITDANIGQMLIVDLGYSELMDLTQNPTIEFQNGSLDATLIFVSSEWTDDLNYQATYSISDDQVDEEAIEMAVTEARDIVGNNQVLYSDFAAFDVEMLNPAIAEVLPSAVLIDNSSIGTTFSLEVEFTEDVDQAFTPVLDFPVEDPSATLSLNLGSSAWLDATTYRFDYNVADGLSATDMVDVNLANVFDLVGNPIESSLEADVFYIDIASGLDDLENGDLFVVYPNPVGSGQDLMVMLNERMEGGIISFVDPLGRVIEEWPAKNMYGTGIRIPTMGLSAGTYTVRFTNGEVSSAHQVILTK